MTPEEQSAAATGWDAAVEYIAKDVGYGWTDKYKAANPYLDLDQRSHVTPSNPTGEARRCERRDLHGPHEWQAEFGAYFNVYCSGNDGTKP